MAEEKKQEQQVVETIVEEEYVEEPSKWSFLKYVKSIARYKWWVIGFSLFGAVAGYLGFRLMINPIRKELSSEYTYDLAGTYTDTETIRFIDGTLFNPYDLASRENLQKVKDSNEKYSSVNLDKIVANGAIIITRKITYYNENDTENTNINYSISAKAKYFPSDDLGKEFIYDLVNYAKVLSTNAIANYNTASCFTDNFANITFAREINQLREQYAINDDVYSSLSNKFGNSVIADTKGLKLYDLQNEYRAGYYTSSVQDFITELESALRNKKYVNYINGHEEDAISNIKNQCENYIQEIENDNRKIAVYQSALDKLVATTSEYRDDIAKEIALLTERITNIKLEIDNLEEALEDSGYFLDTNPASPTYNKYVLDELNEDSSIYKLTHLSSEWVSGCNDFKERITEYKSKLENDRQNTTKVYQYCYSQYQNKVNIEGSGYVVLSGYIDNIIGAAIGLVAAFIITSLITASVYIYKNDKNKSEKE